MSTTSPNSQYTSEISSTGSTPHTHITHQGSCIHCRRRKIKCDKQLPCSNCRRTGSQCVLAPRRRPLRHRNGSPTDISHSDREAELMKRLNKLENMVKDLSAHSDALLEQSNARHNTECLVLPEKHTSEVQKNHRSDHPNISHIDKDFGTLMMSDKGKSRYVSHNFFARLSEELVDDIVQLMFGYRDEDAVSSPETVDSTLPESPNTFVFGYHSMAISLSDFHPHTSHLNFFVEMYKERVDPMVKILHMPSVQVVVEEARANHTLLSRSDEALLFAIYFSVVISLPESELISNLGMEKKPCLERYRFAVEQALSRANFLDSSEGTTLQAFVLYLSTVRCVDQSRVGQNLQRAAIGVAKSMGLHRDGTSFNLSPFETEIRRRIWWQLCILDFRDSEKHSIEPAILQASFDTQRPLNIEDEDLHPDTAVYPEERKELTVMTLMKVACELSFAVLTLQWSALEMSKHPTDMHLAEHPHKEEQIQKFSNLLREKYTQYCNTGTAMAYITRILCELVVCRMETCFRLPLARSQSAPWARLDGLSGNIKDSMFLTSIRIIELRRELYADITKRWHWYLQTIVQWHATAFLLSELCVRDPDETTARAWRILDLVFQDCQNWDDVCLLHGVPGVLIVPMKRLVATATRKRVSNAEVVTKSGKNESQDDSLTKMPSLNTQLLQAGEENAGAASGQGFPDSSVWMEGSGFLQFDMGVGVSQNYGASATGFGPSNEYDGVENIPLPCDSSAPAPWFFDDLMIGSEDVSGVGTDAFQGVDWDVWHGMVQGNYPATATALNTGDENVSQVWSGGW